MTRFAKLSLLLIVAGAFALAGCGGDDNGGLSAEDMARIAAAEDAAEMAAAEADAAQAAADAAQAEAEAAAAAQAEAEAEIAAAQAAADAAQTTADAAQAAADQAAMDAAEDTTASDLTAAWEAIAGPVIETDLMAQIELRTMNGNIDHADLVAAITATAMAFGVDATGALAALEAANPAYATLRRAWVDRFVMGLHEAGELAASRDSVVYALTGPMGDGPPVGQVVNTAWQEIVAPAISAEIAKAANFGTTGPRTIAQMAAAATRVAEMYGLDPAAAVAYINDGVDYTDSVHRDSVDLYAAAVADILIAMATRDTAVMVLAAESRMAADTDDDTDTETPGPDPATDMAKLSYIDSIIAMDDIEEMVTGDISNDADDYATSELLNAGEPSEASHGDNIYTFSSLISEDGFAEVTADARVWGAWGKYNAFGVIAHSADPSMISAYSFGVEANAPTGRKSGNLTYEGIFRGVHREEVPGEWDTTAATPMVVVTAGTPVNGRVDLDIQLDDEGMSANQMMTATFDRFSGAVKGDHTIANITVMKNGSFSTPTDGTPIETGHGASKVAGQFYGPNAEEAGGLMTLINGFGDDGSVLAAFTSTVDANGRNAGEAYHIIGSFGAD